MNEQRQRSASLGCVSLIAVFFVALAALGLAYQIKPSYFIDIGARDDKPYVSNFEAREPDIKKQKPGDLTYRWTHATSNIDLLGIASQDVTVTLHIAAGANPNHQLTVYANDQQVPTSQTLLTDASYSQISFRVPSSWFNDGNLHLKLVSPLFQPSQVLTNSTDQRQLGYALDWVKIEPLQNNFLPFVRPPTDSFLPLLIISVLSVLILFSIGVPTPLGFLGGFAVIGGLCYWLIFDRLSLTVLLQQNFTESLFFIWLAVWAAAEFGPQIYKLFGVTLTRRESGWLAGIFLLQFMLLYGVMLHPQFASSDVGLDVNGLYRTQSGNYYFTTELPNGLPQPYPPAYYLILQPLALLTDNSRAALTNLIQLTDAALQATAIFLIYYLSAMLRQLPRQITDTDLVVREEMEHGWEVGTNWSGILACALWLVCRYVYEIFSAGNFTNLFGAWVFLLFLTVTAGTLGYFRIHQGLVLNRLRRLRTAPITSATSVIAAAGSGIVHLGRHQASTQTKIESELQPVGAVVYSTQTASGEDLITQSPFASNSASQLRVNVENPTLYEIDEDRIRPSLLQRGWGSFTLFVKRAVWPRFLSTLRYLLPLLLLIVVLTSHYGVFLFTNVFMVCAIVLLGLFGGAKGRRDALYLVVIYLLALATVYILYYSHFVDIIGSEVTTSLNGNGQPKKTFDLGLALTRLYKQIRDDFGLLVLFAAGGGIAFWLVNWWQAAFPDQQQVPPRWRQRFAVVVFGRLTPLNALLVALFITGLIFALGGQVIGLDSRYQLYTLPLVVLAAGALLGRLWRSSVVGVVLVTALFIFQLLTVLVFWLDRLTYYPG